MAEKNWVFDFFRLKMAQNVELLAKFFGQLATSERGPSFKISRTAPKLTVIK